MPFCLGPYRRFLEKSSWSNSSKSPVRLAYLLRQSGLDVHPVHLIRNPKGQIYSVAKKHGGFLNIYSAMNLFMSKFAAN